MFVIAFGSYYLGTIQNNQHNIGSNKLLPNSGSSNTSGDKKEAYNYPRITPFSGEYSNKFSCSSIVNNILQSDDGFISKQPGIFSIQNVSSPDKFALGVICHIHILQTDVNVKGGSAQGEQMEIVSNTSDNLLAIKQAPLYIDVFSLNKGTGLAIANITRSISLVTNINPQSESEYLLCQ